MFWFFCANKVYEIRDSIPRAVEGSLLPLNIDDFITHGSIEAGNDNRNLVDDSNNQKLAMDDIVKMKTGEGGGAAVIAALVNHSSTFKTKTEFSQAKYVKTSHALWPVHSLTRLLAFGVAPAACAEVRLFAPAWR